MSSTKVLVVTSVVLEGPFDVPKSHQSVGAPKSHFEGWLIRHECTGSQTDPSINFSKIVENIPEIWGHISRHVGIYSRQQRGFHASDGSITVSRSYTEVILVQAPSSTRNKSIYETVGLPKGRAAHPLVHHVVES